MSQSTIAEARQKEMNASIPVVTTMARVCFRPVRALPAPATRSAVAGFTIAAKIRLNLPTARARCYPAFCTKLQVALPVDRQGKRRHLGGGNCIRQRAAKSLVLQFAMRTQTALDDWLPAGNRMLH